MVSFRKERSQDAYFVCVNSKNQRLPVVNRTTGSLSYARTLYYFFFITEFTTRTLLTSLSVLVNMSTFHTWLDRPR